VDWEELNTRVWRGRSAAAARAVISTGFLELDSYLPGGGWPNGAITEIFVDGYGIGELALLMPAVASLTCVAPAVPKKWVAWVAPPFIPYAPALQQYGVDTGSVLMIHPAHGNKSCLWAIEQAVRSGSSACVLAWVAAADDVILRRLQLAAEDQICWTVLFRPHGARQQRSPAALRLRLSQHSTITRIEIMKCRGGRPGIVDLERRRLEPRVKRPITEAHP
jgi:hypothetical protein